MLTGPRGTRPAVVALIAGENALTEVAFPFFTRVYCKIWVAAGSIRFTQSCNTFGVNVKKLFCSVWLSTMKTGALRAAIVAL
tara:strand:+ start:97 stop:342 length:246 start_codon:yes stop_codon:yes gene_type:complete